MDTDWKLDSRHALDDESQQPLIGELTQSQASICQRSRWTPAIYVSLTISVFLHAILSVAMARTRNDAALAMWSPANHVVSYKTHTFESHFFNASPYTDPFRSDEEKDEMWESLYDFGISGLSRTEAAKLNNSTLTHPTDPDTYVIQLEVFHNLHCLNMVRKALEPERYPEMWSYFEDGTLNRNGTNALHIGHCIDTLRQSIMCDADVTPISFHHNPKQHGIFPKLTATHTCRDWEAIVSWAKDRQVEAWDTSPLI